MLSLPVQKIDSPISALLEKNFDAVRGRRLGKKSFFIRVHKHHDRVPGEPNKFVVINFCFTYDRNFRRRQRYNSGKRTSVRLCDIRLSINSVFRT